MSHYPQQSFIFTAGERTFEGTVRIRQVLKLCLTSFTIHVFLIWLQHIWKLSTEMLGSFSSSSVKVIRVMLLLVATSQKGCLEISHHGSVWLKRQVNITGIFTKARVGKEEVREKEYNRVVLGAGKRPQWVQQKWLLLCWRSHNHSEKLFDAKTSLSCNPEVGFGSFVLFYSGIKMERLCLEDSVQSRGATMSVFCLIADYRSLRCLTCW